MDIIAINDAIEDLEQGDTTLDTVQELAALYIVRNNIKNEASAESNEQTDVTEEELNDILPSYKQYKEIKRKYQMNEATSEGVLCSLKLVCKEIYEFISMLYSHTDFPKERIEINSMLQNLLSISSQN